MDRKDMNVMRRVRGGAVRVALVWAAGMTQDLGDNMRVVVLLTRVPPPLSFQPGIKGTSGLRRCLPCPRKSGGSNAGRSHGLGRLSLACGE